MYNLTELRKLKYFTSQMRRAEVKWAEEEKTKTKTPLPSAGD